MRLRKIEQSETSNFSVEYTSQKVIFFTNWCLDSFWLFQETKNKCVIRKNEYNGHGSDFVRKKTAATGLMMRFGSDAEAAGCGDSAVYLHDWLCVRRCALKLQVRAKRLLQW